MLIHPYEKVDHEENIECQINLLRCVLSPWDTGLDSVTERGLFIRKLHYLIISDTLPAITR